MNNIEDIEDMNGFSDHEDLMKCVLSVDLRTPEKLAAFERWKLHDGTKAGLLKLPTMPKPTSRGLGFATLALLLAASCTGCLGPSSKQLPAIIAALAKDTNTCYLRVTSPTFGTLEFQRNIPPDQAIKSGKGGM